MDGGRRLLRSLKGAFAGLAFARPALAGVPEAAGFEAPGASLSSYTSFAPRPALAGRRRANVYKRPHLVLRIARMRGTGVVLATALLTGSALFGAVRGGQYDVFVRENGSPVDVIARILGFGIDSVTITGSHGLYETEILAAAGITQRNSLLFLDVGEVRDRLREVPLIKDVSVRKLYPDRLLVEIVEREPFAVWQKEGRVLVVAADGTPIQELNDSRFTDLPFVVGNGANTRIPEFLKIVDAAGEMRTKIRAGVLVGERRWNIKMNNGLDVKLPENEPEEAIAQFARIAREGRLLDKDLVSVDLRVPGRMYARLTEEAAAIRAEALTKTKKKGGPT